MSPELPKHYHVVTNAQIKTIFPWLERHSNRKEINHQKIKASLTTGPHSEDSSACIIFKRHLGSN